MKTYRLRIAIEQREEGKGLWDEMPYMNHSTHETKDFSVIHNLFKALSCTLFYWRIT